MNEVNYHIQGIYDLRTLKFLQGEGINSFGFSFDPRNFNFIQEHVFLELLKNNLSENDTIYLSFKTNTDYMIPKLIEDINLIRPSFKNIYFLFDIIGSDIGSFSKEFYVNYYNELNKSIFDHPYSKGMIINFSYFDEIFDKYSLEKYCQNLMFRFPNFFRGNKKLGLETKFSDNLLSSIFELLDFDIVSIPISSDIEICYRNIDQQKLKKELNLKRKYINF